MPLFKVIISGYAQIARKLRTLFVVLIIIAVSCAVIVFPIWYFADRAPSQFTRITVLLMALFACAYMFWKIVIHISQHGIVHWLLRATTRLGLIVTASALIYGVLQSILWIRMSAIFLLLIFIGVVAHILFRKQKR